MDDILGLLALAKAGKGGNACSWNDLKDKPFYEEEDAVLFNGIITIEDGWAVFNHTLSLLLDCEYTIIFNGNEYKVISQRYTEENYINFVYGDTEVYIAQHDNEPFAYLEVDGEDISEGDYPLIIKGTMRKTIEDKYVPTNIQRRKINNIRCNSIVFLSDIISPITAICGSVGAENIEYDVPLEEWNKVIDNFKAFEFSNIIHVYDDSLGVFSHCDFWYGDTHIHYNRPMILIKNGVLKVSYMEIEINYNPDTEKATWNIIADTSFDISP